MAKFKHKKTGKVVEAELHYYVNRFKNDPNYEEVKPSVSKAPKENKEVEDKPLQ